MHSAWLSSAPGNTGDPKAASLLGSSSCCQPSAQHPELSSTGWLTDRQTAAHGHSTDNASLLHVAHSSSLSFKLVGAFLRNSNPYLQRSNLLLLQDFPAAVTHQQEKVGPADDKGCFHSLQQQRYQQWAQVREGLLERKVKRY